MRALICGVSGQDGTYLAHFLLKKGYEVYGSSRDAQTCTFSNLVTLGIRERVTLISLAINDFRSVLQALINVRPDEIYNLAGQSSVKLSFEQPVETMESISLGTLNLLEAIRFTEGKIKFYNAGSSECFGNTDGSPADEETPFNPRSPYAVAKASAYWSVANYREAYDLFACTGILFNHESPLRPSRFVTQKIVTGACQIARGNKNKLYLGNIDIKRDWGWAPEYVEAMWLMLQQDKPEDFVISTGIARKLKDFIAIAFNEVGLNWEDWVETDSNLLRPTDIRVGYGNSSKAKRILDWQTKFSVEEIVKQMVLNDPNGNV